MGSNHHSRDYESPALPLSYTPNYIKIVLKSQHDEEPHAESSESLTYLYQYQSKRLDPYTS
jgi:hypothetical protein